WEGDSVTGPVNVKFTHHEIVMRMYRAGWAFGIAILFVACKEPDCGQGHEIELSGIRESTVAHWRERTTYNNPSWTPAQIERSVCFYLCSIEDPFGRKYSD